jgi:hypothetical protein
MADTPPRLDYPNLRWPDSGWWFTIIGTLVGLLLLVAPDATNQSFRIRLLACVGITLLPASVILAIYPLRIALVRGRRLQQYDALHSTISNLQGEVAKSATAIQALVQEREDRRAFKIEYCYFYESTVVVAISRRQGIRLQAGSKLIVVDQSEWRNLATIQITGSNGKCYLAKGLDDFDPLWLGYIRQAGASHSSPPPGAIALHITETGENND